MMFLPLPIPNGPTPNGPRQSLEKLNLPPLPTGWFFEVTDRGGSDTWLDCVLGQGPCRIWLFGPGTNTNQEKEIGISRDPQKIRNAANRIIQRAQQHAHTYGGHWNAFI